MSCYIRQNRSECFSNNYFLCCSTIIILDRYMASTLSTPFLGDLILEYMNAFSTKQ